MTTAVRIPTSSSGTLHDALMRTHTGHEKPRLRAPGGGVSWFWVSQRLLAGRRVVECEADPGRRRSGEQDGIEVIGARRECPHVALGLIDTGAQEVSGAGAAGDIRAEHHVD